MRIGIGNDHTAVEMKKEIVRYLEAKGYEMVNYGTDSTDSFNYPVSGYRVGNFLDLSNSTSSQSRATSVLEIASAIWLSDSTPWRLKR